MWNEKDLTGFLNSIVGPSSRGSSLAKKQPEWAASMIRSCMAIVNEDYSGAEEIRIRFMSNDDMDRDNFDFWLQNCLFFFGLIWKDMRLVKYVVEVRGVSRHHILSHWTLEYLGMDDKSRAYNKMHALRYAMDNGQKVMAEYLLQDWVAQSFATNSFASTFNTSEPFQSEEYFTEIFHSPPNDFRDMSYTEQSIWFFCRRYLKAECPQNYRKEVAIERLLSDEDFLLTLVRFQDAGISYDHLWELYGHDKSLFLTMMNKAKAMSIGYFLGPGYPGHMTDQMKQILQSWCHGLSPKPQVAYSMLLTLQNDWHSFESQWEGAGGHSWITTDSSENAFDYPFLHGLNSLAGQMYERLLTAEAERAINVMSQFKSNHLDFHHPTEPTDEVNQNPSQISYLLAAAGSGKTHRMFRMLKDQYGLYIVSGAVGKQPHDAGDHLYQPRASIKSGDTGLLFRTLELARTYSDPNNLDEDTADFTFETRCDLLLQNRLRLFNEIFDVAFTKGSESQPWQFQPWQWLRYQLSYNQNDDPFRRLLHCLFLGNEDLVSNHGFVSSPSGLQLLWCFDEVQCDLEPVPSILAASRKFPKMSTLSAMISALAKNVGQYGSVLAGTALNLEGFKEAVQTGIEDSIDPSESDPDRSEPYITPLQEFHLIYKDADFESLRETTIRSLIRVIWDVISQSQESNKQQDIRRTLGASLVGNETIFEDSKFDLQLRQLRVQLLDKQEQDAIDVQEQDAIDGQEQDAMDVQKQDAVDGQEQNAMDELVQECHQAMVRVWDEINQQSFALRGRYRWSVCYIEELFRTLILNGELNKTLIVMASEKVQREAKEPLKRRIRDLATSTDPRRQKLAHDVFHMAIQAKLYGRSRILDTEDAAILIEQALAYVRKVEKGKAKVCLAEQLVVDSVMECFWENSPPGDITDQSLVNWQYSASSFGFITEDCLARAIYTSAHEECNRTKRSSFLSNFDDVYKIAPINTHGQGSIKLNLEDFFLENAPGPVAVSSDGSEDVKQWLEQVVRGSPRPLFLLPINSAGPDLMFVLRNNSTKPAKRLICAVQSKVVQKLKVDDTVLNTLDPDQWYRGSQKLYERAEFLEMFEMLKNETKPEKVEYLSILLDACNENGNVDKIIEELITKKQNLQFAQDIMDSAQKREIEAQKRLSKITKQNQTKFNKTTSDVRRIQTLMTSIHPTEYYAKILTHDSVEQIFGPVYYRILRGMKNMTEK